MISTQHCLHTRECCIFQQSLLQPYSGVRVGPTDVSVERSQFFEDTAAFVTLVAALFSTVVQCVHSLKQTDRQSPEKFRHSLLRTKLSLNIKCIHNETDCNLTNSDTVHSEPRYPDCHPTNSDTVHSEPVQAITQHKRIQSKILGGKNEYFHINLISGTKCWFQSNRLTNILHLLQRVNPILLCSILLSVYLKHYYYGNILKLWRPLWIIQKSWPLTTISHADLHGCEPWAV